MAENYVRPYLDTLFIIVFYRCKIEHENCQRCHICTYEVCPKSKCTDFPIYELVT